MKSNPVFIVPGFSVEKMEPLGKDHAQFNEQYLQNLLAEFPDLLPVHELRPDIGSLLCIGREITVGGSGTLDNLYLSTTGYPVIVEVKLWRNEESRRKVLAQTLDYIKEIVRKDFHWFRKQWESHQKKNGMPAKELVAALSEQAGEEIDERYLIDRANQLLKRGELLALIVGDGIETRLQELIDYVCQDSAQLRYALALVELTCYRFSKYDPNGLIVVPQIVQNVEPVQRAYVRIDVAKELAEAITVTSVTEPEKPSRRQTLSESDFLQSLEECRGRHIRDEVEKFYSELVKAYNLEVEPTGTSLMLKLPHPTGDYSGASLLGIEKEGRLYNPKTLNFLLSQWQIESESVEEIVNTYWMALHLIDQRFALQGLKATSSNRFPPFDELRSKTTEIAEEVGKVVARINTEFDGEV